MKEVTGISLDSEILKKAKEDANKRGRSFSNYIEHLLRIKFSDTTDNQVVKKLKRKAR